MASINNTRHDIGLSAAFICATTYTVSAFYPSKRFNFLKCNRDKPEVGTMNEKNNRWSFSNLFAEQLANHY